MDKALNEITIRMSKKEFLEIIQEYFYNYEEGVSNVEVEVTPAEEDKKGNKTIKVRAKISKQIYVFDDDRIVDQMMDLTTSEIMRITTYMMDNEDLILRSMFFNPDDENYIILMCEPTDNYYESEKTNWNDKNYHYEYFDDFLEEAGEFFSEFSEKTKNINKEELKEHLTEVKDAVEKTVSSIIDKLAE